jgi:hypothetical protein
MPIDSETTFTRENRYTVRMPEMSERINECEALNKVVVRGILQI